jgi:hypothetical protein
MMMRRILTILLLTIPLMGQISYYSSYGFGMASAAVSARYLALGQTKLAITDSIGLNNANPALWNRFVTTSIDGQLGATSFTSDKGFPGAARVQFLGFSMKFPIGKDIGIALGISPYTRMIGELTYVDSTDFHGSMVPYRVDIDIKGGISQAYLGAGFRMNPALRLGLKVRLLFGNYLTKMASEINTNGAVTSYFRKYTILEGSQVGLGMHWNSPNRKLAIGAYLDHNISLQYSGINDYYYGSDDSTAAKQIGYPTTIGIGLCQKLSKSLAFSTDLGYSIVSNSLYQDFYIFEASESQNPFFLGIGLEKQVSPRINAPLWQRLSFRTGAFYQTGSVYRDGGISETGVSFGIGVPFNHYSNRIDLAMVVSVRDGFLADTIGKEKVLSFYASITTGELWFRRFRRY